GRLELPAARGGHRRLAMTQYRPSHNTGPTAWARIHPGAITHNLHWLRQRLHAATPRGAKAPRLWAVVKSDAYGHGLQPTLGAIADAEGVCVGDRSEEHTSELQSRENLVCRLLLEKNK